MLIEKIKGVIPASITPFTYDRKVDTYAMKQLIHYYIDNKFSAAFINSSTGEYFSMSPEQRKESLCAAVKASAHKLIIMAGISEDNAYEAIKIGRQMADCGADIAVAMPPRFYAYSEDELFAFFTDIADHISIPLIIYNHMTRLNNKLSVELICRLSEHPNIIGAKDTHNDAARLMTLLERLKNREFLIYAGGDAMAGFSSLFGGYMLNALCAIAPKLFQNLQRAGEEGNVAKVMSLQQKVNNLAGLFQIIKRPSGSTMSLFYQPIKAALKVKNLCGTDAAHLGFDITEEELYDIKAFLSGF